MHGHQLNGKAEINECRQFLRYAPAVAGDRVLDLGIGNGYATRHFMKLGCQVDAIGIDVDRVGLRAEMDELRSAGALIDEGYGESLSHNDQTYDLVWCSHMLEHSFLPGQVLSEIHRVLKNTGSLFIIVPPYTDTLHGGHVVGGWNLLQLMYLLLLNQYGLLSGHFIQTEWNTVALVKKVDLDLPKLRMGHGDIDKLKPLFPFAVHDDMPGEAMRQWNWPPPSNGECE